MLPTHINTIQGLKKALFLCFSSKPLFNRKITPAFKTGLVGKTFKKFLIFCRTTVGPVWDNKYCASSLMMINDGH